MSRQYDNYIHSLLEPDDILIRGRERKIRSTIFEDWDWLNNLTDEERQRMAEENAQEQIKQHE